MIDYSYYTNVEQPKKADYENYTIINTATMVKMDVEKSFLKEQDYPVPTKINDTKRTNEFIITYNFNSDAYSAAVSNTRILEKELMNEFKEDLRLEYNLTKEQGDKVYHLAYEYGHSNGLKEIEIYYYDLSVLITS